MELLALAELKAVAPPTADAPERSTFPPGIPVD
jgi:hypothetical protein